MHHAGCKLRIVVVFFKQEEVKAWTSEAVLPIVKSPSRALPSQQTAKRTP